jgi:hypothetical protein
MDEFLLVIQAFPRMWIWDLMAISLLGTYYLLVTDASSRSKRIIAALLAASFVTLFIKPNYWFWVLMSHVAVGIYIIFYLAWTRE